MENLELNIAHGINMFNITKEFLTTLVLALLIASCGPISLSNTEDLKEAKEIIRQKDGSYKVTCKDGTIETITQEQLQTEDVCLAKKTGWILSSGSFRHDDIKSKSECIVSIKTYFYENNLSKVSFNGTRCKLGKHIFDLCKFENDITSCKNKDPQANLEILTIKSHQQFTITDNKNRQTLFEQSDETFFSGIIHNVAESTLTRWKRCKVMPSSPNYLDDIISACGGEDSHLLMTCMSAADSKKQDSGTITVGAVISAKKLKDIFTKNANYTGQNFEHNLYFISNRTMGFYPLDGLPLPANSSYDRNTDFDNQRLGFHTRTSGLQQGKIGNLISVNRCGKDKKAYLYRGVIFTSN